MMPQMESSLNWANMTQEYIKPDYQEERKKRNPVDLALILDETPEINRAKQDNQIVFSSGVVIKFDKRKLPVGHLQRMYSRIQSLEPKPPVLVNPEKGRKEPNPDDPDYIEAYQRWAVESFDTIENLALLRGTEIVVIPDGMVAHDSDEWKEELEILDPDGKIENEKYRLIQWFNIVAMTGDEDTTAFMAGIARAIGASKEDVRAALNGFRG